MITLFFCYLHNKQTLLKLYTGTIIPTRANVLPIYEFYHQLFYQSLFCVWSQPGVIISRQISLLVGLHYWASVVSLLRRNGLFFLNISKEMNNLYSLPNFYVLLNSIGWFTPWLSYRIFSFTPLVLYYGKLTVKCIKGLFKTKTDASVRILNDNHETVTTRKLVWRWWIYCIS